MNYIRIYPPAHNDGHETLWYWEIRSPTDIQDCGAAESGEEAWSDASFAFESEDV